MLTFGGWDSREDKPLQLFPVKVSFLFIKGVIREGYLMKCVRWVFLSVFCWGILGHTASAEAAFVPRRTASVLTAPMTDVPPVLDGKLDEAVWASAQPLREWAYSKGVQQQTEVYLTRDDQNFYLAARCFENNLDQVVVENKGRQLWKNDCLEIYLVPEKKLKLWAHLIIDSEGKSSGSAWILDDWGEAVEGGTIELQCGTGKEENAWIVELAIPIASFGMELAEEIPWAFGANRERWAVTTEVSSFQGGFNKAAEYPDLVMADWDVVFDGVGVKNRSQKAQTVALKMGSGKKSSPQKISLQPGETHALDWESVVDQEKDATFFVELLVADGSVKGREEYILVEAPMNLQAVDLESLKNPTFRPSVLDDPNFFPVSVWIQPASAQVVQDYKEMGVNVFLGGIDSYPKPRDQEWLDAVSDAGMYVILPLKEKYIANGLYKNPAVIGWHTQDEPDLSQKEYHGGPIPPAVLQNLLARARSLPVQIPVFLNLGCGVGDDRFVGRAASFDLFPAYCDGADRISFDVYPCNSLGADGPDRFCTIAKGMDRLYEFSGGNKKLGSYVEVNKFTQARIKDSRGPTPEEVKSQIWIAITHRSQQVLIFCHSWAAPKMKVAGIEPEMQGALKGILAEVHEMAPVLNAPFLSEEESATVKNTLGSRVDCLTKKSGESLYLICANMYNRPEKPEITVPGVTSGRATVLFEGRSVSIRDGKIVDEFEPYGIHRYQIQLK